MRLFWACAVFVLFLVEVGGPVLAQEDYPEELPAAVETVSELTLDVMIRQGGPILWVILGLGFVALVMGVYLFLTVTTRREAPPKLMKRVATQIRAGDIRAAYLMCENRDELMAKILHAGLKMADQERYIIQESMESEGERGSAELWQKISYLNNIGSIAPLLGLLGTVWGIGLPMFVVATLIGRAARFMTVAYLIHRFGSPIQKFIERNFNILTIVFSVLLVGGFVLLRFVGE